MGGPFKLSNDHLLLSTEAPGGLYNAMQLQTIASFCDEYQVVVKATEDQRLALIVAEDHREQVETKLNEAGISVRNYQRGVHQPTTCIGELCPESQQDTMGTAVAIGEQLSDFDFDTPFRIGLNGCSQCCNPCHTLDISLVGDVNGYRFDIGGKSTQIPEIASFMAEGVPAEKAPELIKKIVTLYSDLREGEETLQEVIERAGSSAFVEALAPYSQDAACGDDPFGSEPAAVEQDLEVDGDSVQENEAELAEEEDMLDLDDLPEADEIEVGGSADDAELEDVAVNDDDTSDIDLEIAPDAADLEQDLGADVPIGDGETAEVAEQEAHGKDSPAEDALEPETEVAAAPQPEQPGGDEEGDDLVEGEEEMDAEEVEGEEADRFEEKLEESIAEAESIPEENDENAEGRLEAVALIEAEEEVIEEETEPNVPVGAAEGFGDDLELEHDIEVGQASDLANHNEPGNAPDRVTAPNVERFTPKHDTRPTSPSQGGQAWEFCGVELRGDVVALRFQSGAEILADPRAFPVGGRRELNVGSQKITVINAEQGVSVEVDGFEIFLPKAAA